MTLRTADPRKLHESLRKELDWHKQLESKFSREKDPEKTWLYQMLAVSLTAVWDYYTENLFYAYVNKNSKVFSDAIGQPRPVRLSLSLCEALFTTPDRYLNFRNVGEFIGFGTRYCFGKKDQNPFAEIKDSDKKRIDQLLLIRNYIVHASRKAETSYRQIMMQDLGYNRVPGPGKFLKSKFLGYAKAMGNAVDSIEQSPHA